MDLSNAFLVDVLTPFAARTESGWGPGLTVDQVVDQMTGRPERLRMDVQEAIDLLVHEIRLQEIPSHEGGMVVPPMRYTITDRGTALLDEATRGGP